VSKKDFSREVFFEPHGKESGQARLFSPRTLAPAVPLSGKALENLKAHSKPLCDARPLLQGRANKTSQSRLILVHSGQIVGMLSFRTLQIAVLCVALWGLLPRELLNKIEDRNKVGTTGNF